MSKIAFLGLGAMGSRIAPHLIKAGHDASKAVWMTGDTGALAGLSRGATAIEASTVSPEWLRSLAAAVEAHGASLLDAPVVGIPAAR